MSMGLLVLPSQSMQLWNILSWVHFISQSRRRAPQQRPLPLSYLHSLPKKPLLQPRPCRVPSPLTLASPHPHWFSHSSICCPRPTLHPSPPSSAPGDFPVWLSMGFDSWPTQTGVQRVESEVRIYVFHVQLPGMSYTPPLKLSTSARVQHLNLYLKNKCLPLEEITQVWLLSLPFHSVCPQVPATLTFPASELWMVDIFPVPPSAHCY